MSLLQGAQHYGRSCARMHVHDVIIAFGNGASIPSIQRVVVVVKRGYKVDKNDIKADDAGVE